MLIVVDGLGYAYLRRNGGGSLLHDHMEGAITSVFPPTTAAAVPAFLTGNPPQQHGLTGWFTYLKEFRSIVAVLPFTERGSGKPLAAEGLGPRQLTSQLSLFERIDAPCHTVMPASIAYSVFNNAFSGGAAVHPFHNMRQMFDTIGRLAGENGRPQYIHAYWPEFDRLAHAYGLASSQVWHHYGLLNDEFTRFKHVLAGTDTIVIITADHGFIDSDPNQLVRIEDHPVLSDALAMPLSGEPRLAYCYVRAAKRSQFEAYVHDELGDQVDIYPSEQLIRSHLFGLGERHPGLSERIGHYVLVAKGRATIRDRVGSEGPVRDIGVHGGTSADEMYVPLVVMTG